MAVTFDRILADLARPEAYPHPVRRVSVAQTHISAVFLTGRFAYKVKKPVDFGFLDYSTPALRRKFCELEIELNRRLAPNVYLDVVPVVEGSDGRLRIGEPTDAPAPDSEWAVRMRQLPAKHMLPRRLEAGTVTEADIRRIGERLARFHADAEQDEETRSFSTPEQIRETVAGNLKHAGEAAGPNLPPEQREFLTGFIDGFVRDNAELLWARAATGMVRRCHGDLRLQNVCLAPTLGDGLQIFDCIEFNPRYQCVDVLADLAYLAMDLDLAGRADLRWHLLDAYGVPTDDPEIQKLLRFYQCYRACVRGKIGMLAADEEEVPAEKRWEEREIADDAFNLACVYGEAEPLDGLTIMYGFSGSGKSEMAGQLSRRLGSVLLSADALRKELAGVPLESRLPAETYTPENRKALYGELFKRAGEWLKRGERVILDATFLRKAERDRAAKLAQKFNVRLKIVECYCSDRELRWRLTERGPGASDAREAVYDQQLRDFDPLTPTELCMQTGELQTIDTTEDLW